VDEHGTAVGDEIGRMTVEEIEELLSTEDEEDDSSTNTTAKKFLKAVSASCRHLGVSAEAAQDARRKCFALQDFFGMHSLFVTITIDDECSFRVRLYPYANANNEGVSLLCDLVDNFVVTRLGYIYIFLPISYRRHHCPR
jgi:hypothetical protein